MGLKRKLATAALPGDVSCYVARHGLEDFLSDEDAQQLGLPLDVLAPALHSRHGVRPSVTCSNGADVAALIECRWQHSCTMHTPCN